MFITTDFLNFKTIAGKRRGPEEGFYLHDEREKEWWWLLTLRRIIIDYHVLVSKFSVVLLQL